MKRKTRITVTIEIVIEADLDVADDEEGLSLTEEQEIINEGRSVANDFSWRGVRARETPFVSVEAVG